MIKIIKKLGVLLDKKQKDFMIVLVLMMLVGALLETASVGIIIPVMKYTRTAPESFHLILLIANETVVPNKNVSRSPKLKSISRIIIR